MAFDQIFRKPLTTWLATAAMAGVLALTHVAAHADGPPLILDTQKGIIDGQKGMVLQNAPLSHEPMVTARQPAAPAGIAADGAPPYIIVEPRIKASGSGTRSSSTRSGSTGSSKFQLQSTPQTAPAQ
jgi:hypothetical protein